MKRFAALLFLSLAAFAKPPAEAPLTPDAARRMTEDEVTAILDALARADFERLASFVDGEGLVVSPYVMLDPEDIRLSRSEVENCGKDKRVRLWGHYDGRGDPIEMTCRHFFSEFVWDADYRKADEVLYNEPRRRGNEINNNHELAPNGIVVELHIRGKSAETELDWKSLRLVFRKSDQGLSLIAITRDVWTI